MPGRNAPTSRCQALTVLACRPVGDLIAQRADEGVPSRAAEARDVNLDGHAIAEINSLPSRAQSYA